MKSISFKQGNRQNPKKPWIAFMLGMMLIPSINAQVDYSKKSNILDADTLKGIQKKVFEHFVMLTYKEAKALEPLEVKAELAKLGITITNREQFLIAYNFFDSDVIYHKKSCENFESFKDLEPKK